MPDTPFGTDDQYLESWLQFNVTYRSQIALACYLHALNQSNISAVAAALESFQQYVLSLEDLATWLDTIERWFGGTPLIAAAEVAGARWRVFELLRTATPHSLVGLFHLPAAEEWREPERTDYQTRLESWTELAHDVGEFATREAQNGGSLANRLQNKMKHGLHLAVAVQEGVPAARFYPHQGIQAERFELPAVRLTSQSAELWLRRSYDVARFLAAILRSLFLLKFGRDPTGAWQPETRPNAVLTIQEIAANLEGIALPTIQWR